MQEAWGKSLSFEAAKDVHFKLRREECAEGMVQRLNFSIKGKVEHDLSMLRL